MANFAGRAMRACVPMAVSSGWSRLCATCRPMLRLLRVCGAAERGRNRTIIDSPIAERDAAWLFTTTFRGTPPTVQQLQSRPVIRGLKRDADVCEQPMLI